MFCSVFPSCIHRLWGNPFGSRSWFLCRLVSLYGFLLAVGYLVSNCDLRCFVAWRELLLIWQFVLLLTLLAKLDVGMSKMGVKTPDMCLSGQYVANMVANMLATQHKKLLARVTLMLGQHVTCWHVGLMSAWCQQTCVCRADMLPTCCRHVPPQSIKLSKQYIMWCKKKYIIMIGQRARPPKKPNVLFLLILMYHLNSIPLWSLPY